MIKDITPLSMAEAIGYVSKSKDEGKEIKGFVKKFTKFKPVQAKEMRNKFKDLKLIKIDEKDISKIIDILPENAEEVNKIFMGVGLDEEEVRKILGVVKELK